MGAVDETYSPIQSLGVEILNNQRLGRDFSLGDLKTRGFEAVFLGIGAHKSRELAIEGARELLGRAGLLTGYPVSRFTQPHLRAAIWRNLALAEAELRRGEELAVERLDLDGDGAEELWIHAAGVSLLVSPLRGGVIEEYSVFEQGINFADVLTRRRESYHEPAPGRGSHEATATSDGTPSIHELEQMARLQQLPPIDPVDRALFVDRVLASDITLEGYTGGAFQSLACWSHTAFQATEQRSAPVWPGA